MRPEAWLPIQRRWKLKTAARCNSDFYAIESLGRGSDDLECALSANRMSQRRGCSMRVSHSAESTLLAMGCSTVAWELVTAPSQLPAHSSRGSRCQYNRTTRSGLVSFAIMRRTRS